jgi:DNA-directed RNA polymerase subunit H
MSKAEESSTPSKFELYDHLFHSRKTILKILSQRGYDIKPYEKFGPTEIDAMYTSNAKNPNAFRMDLTRSKELDSPITKCAVLYCLERMRNKVDNFISDLITKDDKGVVKIDPATTEVVVMLAADTEPNMEIYNQRSYTAWSSAKLRIFFFRIQNLIIHPAEHVLVPKHEKVSRDEIKSITTQPAKLPFIKYHEDMQARVLGLVPGDIVKITRPSPSSGEYIVYRICSP